MSRSETTSQNRNNETNFYQSELYHNWFHRVATGRPNDFVIAISAHPGWTGTSGTGKSTLAGGLAKWYLDISPDGWSSETSYTMDPSELAHNVYPDTDQGAALVGDEMQGTLASTGMNSKRAMKTEQLEVYNTVAGRRRDRKTLILIFQTLKRANKDLFDFVDAWLLITDDVNYVAEHYAVMPDVFNLESNKTKTPHVETLSWDPLPVGDPDYEYMEELKSKANKGVRTFSGDDDDEQTSYEIPKEVRDEKIRELAKQGVPQRTIGDTFGIKQSTVSKIVNHKA